MSKYGHSALNIRRAYSTDPAVFCVSRKKMVVFPAFLSNKRWKLSFVILLNLAEYRLILANSAYGLVG